MAKLMNVEAKIQKVEKFAVTFRHLVNGADVHGDKQGIPQYPYKNKDTGDHTVSEWKEKRFGPNYPGYEVDVLNGDGEPVAGQMKLDTVRATYTE